MYVFVSLQQLERQYSITDRERMEAVFNQRQLQQALATAQVRMHVCMYVCMYGHVNHFIMAVHILINIWIRQLTSMTQDVLAWCMYVCIYVCNMLKYRSS